MEKYYLGKLEGIGDSERSRIIRFIEVQYTRQAPSFGLVYVNTLSTQKFQLNLVVLQLDDNKEVSLSNVRQLQLSVHDISDLDVNNELMLDRHQDYPDCLILADGGSTLLSVQLNDCKDGCIKHLTGTCAHQDSTTGRLIKCRIHHSIVDSTTECYAHLLTEKSYSLCRINHTEASLEIIHRYLMPTNNEYSHLRFVSLHTLTSDNQNLILLEFNNSNFSVIHKGTCLSTFNPSTELTNNFYEPSLTGCQLQQQLLLSSSSTDEYLFISFYQNKLVAHSFAINNSKESGTIFHDPDRLLPREPSFELDKCWTLDLHDIESIRALHDLETGRTNQSCLSYMWYGNQYKQDGSWAKYLVVFYRFHLLIYSFQQHQQSTLPFSVIYDRAFLGLCEAELETTTKLKDQQQLSVQEYIDVKVRPRLIYNFKLIGAQPSDALFNTLLLASRNQQFTLSRHFPQLGLLSALTNSGHLYAFKFTSEQLIGHKDSIYQQLLADSIRRSSRLLLDQIECLQRKNKKLREDIANFHSRFSDSEQWDEAIEQLIKTSLSQREDIGYLYSLDISLSNLVRVNRVIILSTVNSCFFKPYTSSSSVDSIFIDNNATLSKEKTVLLANVHDPDRIELQELVSTSHESEYPVIAYCVINLNASFKSVSLSLPIYIMDGQHGQLRIFHILSDSHFKNDNETLNFIQEEQPEYEKLKRYHLQVIDVKPLISYQIPSFSDKLSKEVQISIDITGSFQQDQIISWLNECLYITKASGSVESPFTHCTITYETGNEILGLISDDLFALELIKKFVLKKATDQSIVLKVSESNVFSLRNLRHLINLQYNNIRIASRLLSTLYMKHKAYEENPELLFESLLSEMSISEFPIEYQVPPFESMRTYIRQDIELLVGAHVNEPNYKLSQPSQVNHRQLDSDEDELEYDSIEQEPTILKDLICGFIIDALVDYDKLNGAKSSNEIMISMRSKLIKIINHSIELSDSISSIVFTDSVLSAWKSCKQ